MVVGIVRRFDFRDNTVIVILSFIRLSFIRLSCRSVVGDGFIRPEVCTLVNSGQATSINAERSNLGTDKSVPYESVRILAFVILPFMRLSFIRLSFIRLAFVILTFMRLSWGTCRGRIYPSRGYLAPN